MDSKKKLIYAEDLHEAFCNTYYPDEVQRKIFFGSDVHIAVSFFAKKSKELIENAPAVDAEEVVRCKDCEFGVYAGLGKFMCDLHEFVGKANFYCASGERKKDG